MIALLPQFRLPRWLRTALFGVQDRARRSVSPSVALGDSRPSVNTSQAVLGLSWRDIPVRSIAPPPPAPSECRRCWNCGRPGLSWCVDECLPTPTRPAGSKPSMPPTAYVPPTEAEEAADARIAAVLDAEAAA